VVCFLCPPKKRPRGQRGPRSPKNPSRAAPPPRPHHPPTPPPFFCFSILFFFLFPRTNDDPPMVARTVKEHHPFTSSNRPNRGWCESPQFFWWGSPRHAGPLFFHPLARFPPPFPPPVAELGIFPPTNTGPALMAGPPPPPRVFRGGVFSGGF